MHPVRAVKTPGPVGPVQGLPLLALAAGALLWRELRHPDPVLQPRFFRLRSFAAASGAIALSNLAMYSTLLTVPLLLAARSNASTVETGLVLGALTVGMVLFAQPGGWLADRFGRRWPVVAGLAVFSVGCCRSGSVARRQRCPPSSSRSLSPALDWDYRRPVCKPRRGSCAARAGGIGPRGCFD